MPWKERSVEEQRRELVTKALVIRDTGIGSFTDLCAHYGVSRRIGYKWVARFDKEGQPGLSDQSRAPRRHPNQVKAESERKILELKQRYPRYGPKTLVGLLEYDCPQIRWPAPSTVGEILKRHGLTAPRRRRPGRAGPGAELTESREANQVWSADYKGWFRTADGQRCEPLTIMDSHSRYLLRCQVVEDTSYERARGIFQACFLEYGMPAVIRTDNGSPFASIGVCGLTRLSVWWVKLGIRPERIRPGRPQQNGRHERMHWTLAQHTTRPPARNWRAQQRRFDKFRVEYNEVRPHQSLGGQRPAWVYRPSSRVYPRRVVGPEYGSGIKVQAVSPGGQFRWKGHKIFLAHALGGEPIGLKPIDERYYELLFGPLSLGVFDGYAARLLTTKEAGKLPGNK